MPMAKLALPVVVAELGWTAMGTVDTLMVGRLGAEAIGAVSLGSAAYLGVAIFGIGLLLGLDTMISQAYGASDWNECHRALLHGIYAAVLFAAPLTGILLVVIEALPGFGVNRDVLVLTVPYLEPVSYSLLPLLLYAAARRFLQATGHVVTVMVVLVMANVVNALANWVLIFGRFGFPELGVVGAGWATFASRTFLAVALLGSILFYDVRARRGLVRTKLSLEWHRVRRLLGLGLPAAIQITLEMGLFTVATALISRLDAASLAAHQVAIAVASTTFMVPLGISSAAAVRVGHAVGRRDAKAVGRGGWTAIAFGVGFMSLSMATLFAIPETIISWFTTERAVLDVGVTLLYVAALFQLFDGMQVVATGALRGVGETRIPMVTAAVGYWMVGLPLGYVLCFRSGYGASGLWIGMAVGLFTVGVVLVWVWSFRVRRSPLSFA
jgi:MATE family multidrug resistance protein